MSDLRILALAAAGIALITMFEMIRRQNLKEKYTVLWLLVAVIMAMFGIFPSLLNSIAHLIGIQSGPNVILLVGGFAVTMVCVHLSVEVSKAEDRTRALAEELGLLRLELEKEAHRENPRP